MIRFASLGSGSSGNATIVERDNTRVMMDCGFSLGETKARLERLGLAPSQLTAIVVTHEHDDHLGGVARFAKRYAIPVYLTRGTAQWLPEDFPLSLVRIIDSHTVFAIGDLQVEPFPVPHDAREPVQYVFGDGAARVGVVTDLGCTTAHVEEKLSACDAIVLECNHDLDMLMTGSYPVSLKHRVSGRFGHLSNRDSGALLANLDCSKLKHIVAAHLSKQNNTPALAIAALAHALGCEDTWVGIAQQDTGFDWREI